MKTVGEWIFLANISHPICIFNHTGLIDGIEYFYKLRAWDPSYRASGFCAQVSGIPEDILPPGPPSDLKIIGLTYNSITLTWKTPSDLDVIGYNIYMNNISEPNNWSHPINDENPVLNTSYTASNLEEGTIYYYVVTALDEVDNESPYSNMIHGKTMLYTEYPHDPEINIPQPDFSIPEDTFDSTTINLFRWFKDINNDSLEFFCEGQIHLDITIFPENGSMIIVPEKDWNGQEYLVFYASDGLANVSDDVIITITPVNDAPGPVRIIDPKDGVKFEQSEAVLFVAECQDPDVIYGDELIFTWYSNRMGNLGSSSSLKLTNLSVGKHLITLAVTDLANENAKTTINITISTKPGSGAQKMGDLDLGLIVGIGIIILILIILIFLFIKKKRNKPVPAPIPDSESEDLKRSEYPSIDEEE